MRNSQYRFPVIGILLIVAGVVLLLNHLDIIALRFSEIFWPLLGLFGLFQAGRGFSRNRSGQIFGGTVLFLYSVFFLLRNSEYVDVRGSMFLPASFLIFGLAFLMMFVNSSREWLFLIPGTLLLGIGALFLLSEADYINGWEAWDIVHTYWPLVLIACGLAIILRRQSGRGGGNRPGGFSSPSAATSEASVPLTASSPAGEDFGAHAPQRPSPQPPAAEEQQTAPDLPR